MKSCQDHMFSHSLPHRDGVGVLLSPEMQDKGSRFHLCTQLTVSVPTNSSHNELPEEEKGEKVFLWLQNTNS